MTDSHTSRLPDERRYRSAIGAIVVGTQAKTLSDGVGRIHGRTVIDVGTGTGRSALLLARGGARVTGVDPSERKLEIARQRAAKEGLAATFVRGDVRPLNFPDRAFEVSVCFRVITHLDDWRDCIAELCRVTDQMVIIDYIPARSLSALRAVARPIARALGSRSGPYLAHSDGAIREALAAAGFRVRSAHRLFVLPLAFHNVLGSRWLTIGIEHALALAGLRKLFGSPVTLVAERMPIPPSASASRAT